MSELPKLPSGEMLPLSYRWIRAHGLHSLTPWHFSFDDQSRVQQWRDRYRAATNKDAWPIAQPQDRMEVAAFPLVNGSTDGSVIIIDTDVFDSHGKMPGTILERYSSFLDWLGVALRETVDWMSEEELEAFLE